MINRGCHQGKGCLASANIINTVYKYEKPHYYGKRPQLSKPKYHTYTIHNGIITDGIPIDVYKV